MSFSPTKRGGSVKATHKGLTIPEPFDITDTRLNSPLHPTRTKVVRRHDSIPATTFGKEERDMKVIPCTGGIAPSEQVLSRVAFQGGVGQQQFKFANRCGGRGTDTIVDEGNYDLKSSLPYSQCKQLTLQRVEASTPSLGSTRLSGGAPNDSIPLTRLFTAPSAIGTVTNNGHGTSFSSTTNTLHGYPYKVNRFAIYGVDSGRSSSAAAAAAQKVIESVSATDRYLDTHQAASALPTDLVNYEALLNPEGHERRRNRQLRAAAIHQPPKRGGPYSTNGSIANNLSSGTIATMSSITASSIGSGSKRTAAADLETYLLAQNNNNARLGTIRDPAAAIEAVEVRDNRPKTFEALHGIRSMDLVGNSRRNNAARTVNGKLRCSTFAGRGTDDSHMSSTGGRDETAKQSSPMKSSTGVVSPGPAAYTLKGLFDHASVQKERGILQNGERLPLSLGKNGLGGLDTQGQESRRRRCAGENVDDNNGSLAIPDDEGDLSIRNEDEVRHAVKPPTAPKNVTQKLTPILSETDGSKRGTVREHGSPTVSLSPLRASGITHNVQLRQQHQRRDLITNATPDRLF